MSKINDELLGHADEADGIEEYDNPLPDWWVGMFLICIAWAGVYFVDWHIVTPKSQAGLYEAELQAAEARWPGLDKDAAFDDSPEVLAKGAELFAANCVSCHGTNLEGGIGPNLVDDEWIHGSGFEDISGTIEKGVAAKGMPSWGPILGPSKVSALASYIVSRAGSATAPAPTEEAAGDAAPAGDGAAEGTEAGGQATAAAGGEVDGAAVFTTNCVACHMADMTGGIGPNLVDDEWIHGGDLAQIRTTIENGVPAKGMISWKGTLSDAEIEAVSEYIYEQSH